ncbi:cell division protein ZapA [Natranaerovirga hydrolytica]|uniref:Cell division protein ZapA n=1 Tax=Natranaerovirga hydrolytica TaxID=680378 RepID=A0A4R1N054_9FIRM|nr:cell division protein ZapA [Natranaerovirga hydrolytica]TCK98212.1 cell division protein ZapA [Natranaerovirga hydrolytica]
MSPKKDIQVLIGGKVYTLCGEESEEYMQKVALYINNKMSELQEAESAKKLNTHMAGILLALNVADDLFKAKEELNLLTTEVSKNLDEKEDYVAILENELLNEKAKLENAEAAINKLKEEKSLLEQQVVKYKKELDEYIETFGD